MVSDFIAYMMSPTMIAYMGVVTIVFVALQISAAVMVYAERKVAALMQQRYGPWLVGPKGLLQPIADIVKLFFKEELQPKAADKLLFSLAPIISVAWPSVMRRSSRYSQSVPSRQGVHLPHDS